MKRPAFRIITAFLLSAALTPSCSKKEEKPDITPPVLSVTPVDIISVTSFIPFGDDLSPYGYCKSLGNLSETEQGSKQCF